MSGFFQRWKLFAAVVAVAGVGWLFIGARRQEERPATPAGKQQPVVAAASARRESLSQNLVLTAEFRPYQEVEVMAKVSGYVRRIYVDVGDRVRQGQVLADLEIPEFIDDQTRADAAVKRYQAEMARARDELRRSQSASEMAQLNYTRLAAVVKTRPGLVAQQEVDDARSRHLMADAQAAGAQSAISAAEEQVRVAQAERTKIATMLSYTRITAPFDGVVTRRFADTGALIQAGTASQTQARPLVRLSQTGQLRLQFSVPESAVPSVRMGATVDVRVPSLDRCFPGRIARASQTLDLATKTMVAEIDVANPGNDLVAGMYAEVSVSIGARRDVVTVPIQAVQRDDKNASLIVINPSGVLERREVSLGMQTSDRAEISKGLSEGELVLLGDRNRLRPGQRVSPRLMESTLAAKGA